MLGGWEVEQLENVSCPSKGKESTESQTKTFFYLKNFFALFDFILWLLTINTAQNDFSF